MRARLSPVRQTRVEETQQYSSLPCGRLVVQTHQVMVDTPYGDCFAVLTKWVFEPLPAAAAATAAAAGGGGSGSGSGGSGGGGSGSSGSGSAAGASGGCSVSVSAELVWFKDTWLKKQIVTSTLDELNSCYEVFLPSIKQRLAAARSS